MRDVVLRGATHGQDLKTSSCLIPISIGHALQERLYFIKTLKLINRTFGKCTIVVADTIYRHTIIPPEGSIETPLKYSQNMGYQWVKSNASYIKKLSIPIELFHWNFFLADTNFNKYLIHVRNLYDNDNIFRELVNKEIFDFISRREKKPLVQPYSLIKDASKHIDYIKEECAVWLLWAFSCRFNFIVYPHRLYKPLTYLRKFFPKEDRGLETNLKLLRIEF